MHLLLILLWKLLFPTPIQSTYVTYTARPRNIHFFYQQNSEQLRVLEAVPKIDLRIRFATNATMFGKGCVPIGLYIEKGKRITAARVFNNPSVNFGMQPQGIFAITKASKALIVPLQQRREADYTYAVQCAPYW